jgi:RNA polymerase sigma-70 factor (ECF subfamily)
LKFKGTFQAGMSFRPWMYKIAHNVHADLLRKRRDEAPLNEWAELRDGAVSAELAIVHAGDLALLRRALDRLPPDKRELLVLCRWQELPYDEIAGILQCEPGAVKTRVFRAMQQLAETFFRLSGRKAS